MTKQIVDLQIDLDIARLLHGRSLKKIDDAVNVVASLSIIGIAFWCHGVLGMVMLAMGSVSLGWNILGYFDTQRDNPPFYSRAYTMTERRHIRYLD